MLLERRRPPGFWQSVTGSLEWGELADAAARREVIEETGITQGVLVNLQWTQVYEIMPVIRQSVCARYHAQSRTCVFAAIAAARARYLECQRARAISLGCGARCAGHGLLEHQPQCDCRVAPVARCDEHGHRVCAWSLALRAGGRRLLRRRLARQLDAETHAFSYASVKSSVSVNAETLGKFLSGIARRHLAFGGAQFGWPGDFEII